MRKTPKKFFPKIKNSEKESKKELKKETTKYPKINGVKFSLALAILNSLTVFLITILNLLNQSLPTITKILLDLYGNFGYSISIIGSIVGAAFVFIDTFLITYLLVWIYNKLL